MANAFPYYNIACPCSDSPRQTLFARRTARDTTAEVEDEDEETAFDPRSPRSNFSIFPPEHLLYCEECHDLKCPRCVTEEIICTYCPSCLFEVPTSSIKPDYNRCSRNCFGCPICTSQLITTSVGDKAEGSWILSCNHCLWSTLDIGIQFEKPQSLRQQVDQRANGGNKKPSYREPSAALTGVRNFITKQTDHRGQEVNSSIEGDRDKSSGVDSRMLSDPYSRFESLKAFYKEQLASTNFQSSGVSGLDAYSSPSSLSRIMNLYTSGGSASQKKSKQHAEPMREASTISEGLLIAKDQPSPLSASLLDYIDSPTPQQLLFQYPLPVGHPQAQHVSELRPMPTLLRTKRAKRCAACKHILVKPEFKVTSTRYRMRLVALNYIPFVTLKPVPVPDGLQAPGLDGAAIILEPGKPSQWVMTLRNPLFENVHVSLGTPSITPGKHGHRVTILCPEFTIDKSGDVWVDALNTTNNSSKQDLASTGAGVANEQTAGKIYDRGRNWTSIVIEVIPKHILHQPDELPERDLDEDEDLIEIPVRVRLSWTVTEEVETERIRIKDGNGGGQSVDTDHRKRELSYWMVIGIGRVKH